jgi:hypothetical protein
MSRGQKQQRNYPQFITAQSVAAPMPRPLIRSLWRAGFLSENPVPVTSVSVLTSLGVLRTSSAGIQYSTLAR